MRARRLISAITRTAPIGAALFAGCYQIAPPLPAPAQMRQWRDLAVAAPQQPIQPAAAVEPAAPALTLEMVVQLALANHPDVAVAQARAQAAQGKLEQAGLYPNPIFRWHASQIGNGDGPAGEQGPILQQTLVTGGKLRLAEQAAEYGVRAADWQAITKWFDVLTRARVAWYELLTARREVEAARDLHTLAESGLGAAEKLLKGGTGTQPDVLRARVELEQIRIRLRVAEERAKAARRQLAAAAGVSVLPDGEPRDNLDRQVPNINWNELRDYVLAASSELQEAKALVQQNERLVARARAEVRPDVQVLLSPFYDFAPPSGARGMVDVGVAVPIFNRNQGNIHAAQADLARSLAEVRQLELRLTERLTLAFQRFESARKQHAALSDKILPDARESVRLIQLGYERGDPKYDYTALLQAQTVLAQAKLAEVQALGELWKALSEIQGLVQIEKVR